VFYNSLVGLQDAHSGVEAYALARQLTSPGGRMSLVRVHSGYRVVATNAHSSGRAHAERALAESDLNLVSRTTGVADTLAVGASSVGEGLMTAVNARHPDLVVLTAGQVLAPGQNLMGMISQVSAPVAITSFYANSAVTQPIANIGVAYDSSAESDRALTVARRLAGSRGGALTGFQVSAPKQGRGGNQAAARAAEDLAAFADTVDLLVLAPRPSRPLRRLLGPGTIEAVIASSATPVILVPAQAIMPAPASPPVTEQWVTAERTAVRAL
jgi:nucleotide-binding universal stress UspA family protein